MQIMFKLKTPVINSKFKATVCYIFCYLFVIKVFRNHSFFTVYFDKKIPESLERENNRLDRNCFGIGFLKLTYTCRSNKVTYFAMLARNLVYQN